MLCWRRCEQITAAELTHRLGSLRSSSKRIAFTNGCFDILHVGHIRVLRESRSMADALVVGLNSDSSVARLKGSTRPLNAQESRAIVLSAISYVDYVCLFEEDTPLNLIRRILPDVLVKGADYRPAQVVGRDVVESHGGEVRIVELVPVVSTTRILELMSARRAAHSHTTSEF